MLVAMGGKIERYFIPAVIGFAPFVLFLLTWDAAGHGFWPLILREFSVTELGAELITIIVAFREGMFGSWKRIRPDRFDCVALGALALLLALALLTAALIAPNGIAAAFRTAYWIVHLLFGFSIAFLCRRLFTTGDLVAAFIAGFVAFVVAFAIFALTFLHRPIDWTWDLPAVVHIRHVGIYATPIIGLCIGWMATRSGRAWAAAFAVAFAGFALFLWTGSRGPAAALAVAVVVGMIVPAMRRPKAWGGTVVALGLASALVAVLPVPAANMGVARTIAATTESNDIGTGRMEMWRRVVGAIERRPVLGYGEGQMPTVAPFYGLGQPHNLVLQLLLAWGVVGLLCALVFAVWFLRSAIPAVRGSPGELLGPFLAMLGLVALSMVDAALYHIQPLSVFAACAGMIAAGWRGRGVTVT
jgi:O-antigen ligase